MAIVSSNTLVALSVLVFAASTPALGQAQWLTQAEAIPEAPSSYAPHDAPPLSLRQRLSIERGVADLGGATEQSLLSTTLYLTSAATLLGGIATTIVLFAEFDRPSWVGASGLGTGWGNAEYAIVGSALASFAVHAITTAFAISVGLNAQRRHERARQELLLTQFTITPFGAALAGQF